MSSIAMGAEYNEIISIIERARENAFRAVNRELISMYREIGKYVSEKVKTDGWGKSVVQDFSKFIQSRYVGIRGFSAQNIWRMKQFYETYAKNEKLSTLSREIGWSNNVLILMGAKSDEAREFYLLLTQKNNYSARELERQMESKLFERTMISNETNKLFISKNPALSSLRDSYILEFLDIPESHRETELRKAIMTNLRNFILEFGKDFSFVGEEYRLQVGNMDFHVDLLFFHRELSCLVAIELKVGKFKPEYLGQLEFYLEALDRDIKKPNENPSVGLILCAEKDDTVVEYALSRSLSPALIADYQLHLPEKSVLESRLRELTELAEFKKHDIRPLSAKHLPIYAEIIRKSFATVAKDYGLTIENFPNHWSFATNERLAEKIKDGYYPFGYFTDEKPVGFVSLTDKGEGIYEMGTVSVLPEYRHLGYGKALLDFCKEKIKELSGSKIVISLVDTHTILKEWYLANGFIYTETKKFEHIPLPIGYMEWTR